MPIKTRVSATFILLTALCFMLGCADTSGGTEAYVPDLGLSMELPSGWVADRQNPRMFFDPENKEDNFGMIENYPLEGQSLDEYVEQMSKIGGTRIISKTSTTISGHAAIEMITEAVYTVIELDIQEGEDIIRVSFRSLTKDYPAHEPLLRNALRSIEIR